MDDAGQSGIERPSYLPCLEPGASVSKLAPEHGQREPRLEMDKSQGAPRSAGVFGFSSHSDGCGEQPANAEDRVPSGGVGPED